ncbi:Methyltransferase domain-containing protein [Malonomonas rubra DSM 5091]|uniref:Methyltransferase domain-containing protein n=1 Tax=Malonomonas rubra DSM 5091 TaxID=1122189 RepID=A0A1M6DS39_MALRU|nr:class I SAM-dependent methyltransferase [Malonomonas rubra]SHI76064.1 Methyltransferase domain-containing protein [Malonomonas rubra DSM 5091]
MSQKQSSTSNDNLGFWFENLSGESLKEEGRTVIKDIPYVMRGGILRQESLVSDKQKQTRDCFGFKWDKRDTFESPAVRSKAKKWLHDRYGDIAQSPWLSKHGKRPLVVDAGCGAGFSALEFFGEILDDIDYLGVDISNAVDVAKKRFTESAAPGAFIQADITKLPLDEGSVDIVFSEGVLHHTDSTENAIKALSKLLKKDGRFLFYVYKKKGPIREYTDDYVRDKLQGLTSEEAWAKLLPLTRFGQVLGELDIEIDVPEAIDLLEIPAGKIDLQRFFYWNVFKAFYRPEFDLQETNHVNFDWFFPANAQRQSPEEVRRWCAEAGLLIEREKVEDAGITIVARKV